MEEVKAKAGEYHLYFSVRPEDAESVEAQFGPGHDRWFATREERAAFRAEVVLLAKTAYFQEHEGPLATKRTVAKMMLVYDGKRYPHEHDFGYAYPADAADYMFMEGNYSCDCNLSIFLSEAHPEVPELDCGDSIDIEDFVIEYRD